MAYGSAAVWDIRFAVGGPIAQSAQEGPHVTIRLFIGALAAVLGCYGQTPDGLPKFDTISIRTAGPRDPSGTDGSAQAGQVTYLRQSLIGLMMQSYGVAVDQIVAPDWMYDAGTHSYNIAVTMPRDTPESQIHLMMRNLLADRFHIAFHHETRSFPGYDLVVAADGPKLKEAGAVTNASCGGSGGDGVIRMRYCRETVGKFAAELGEMIRESNSEVMGVSAPRVADKTGLTGTYAFTLEFTGWSLVPGIPLTPMQKAYVDPDAAKLPDIFGALENQLGLKLVRATDVPLDVLVIDRADAVADGN